ncbi:MAG: DUF1989 domain-containing protein [Rhodospirillaceae bacterium]|nr:DUF1989 domain-containing protein [Rhodospirillaceae bacterium]MBT7647817.1 DUF1989 domain-containing protein [Rhodospirillaceae bacterium]
MSGRPPERVRPRVLIPGIRRLDPGVERYPIEGLGSVVVRVFAGDRLRIVNREGGQVCEIVAMTAEGQDQPGILGSPGDGAATDLRAMLAQGGPAAELLFDALKAKGLPASFSSCIRCFGSDTPAFEAATFDVEADGVIVVAAPAQDMVVESHGTASGLELFITRADPKVAAERNIPDPLAEPRYEHRVKAGEAHAYEVRKGEYIQIMDVEGRECSDFQAISLAKLERGIERDIDPTATRVLMGAAYPAPGLHSKLFDNDLEASIEIIQDTVGRHDSFNFACTAKYYDDVGYPGHVNCTDNFNTELAPWGIKPRGGWQAMNFFYNTLLDDQYQIYLDEPWSRPGDYVLCRAQQDVVAINSACPDAIDPANGWDPTDILVRVYPADNMFRKAIAFRAMPDSDPQMTKETGFHARTSELTRNFTEYNGYWLPSHYTNHGAIDEYWACREGVIAMDLTALRKFEITGPDAGELMQRTLTRNVKKLADGHVVYSAMCYEHGGMIDDGTLFRMSETGYRWIGGTDFGGEWLRQKAQEWGLRALVRNSTDQLHNISVQGPKSRELLAATVWTPPAQPRVDEIDWFRFTIGRIGDHNGVPIVVSRTGYTGELGYEVWCHPKHAVEVWDAVFEAGAPHGITPLGLDALDMLRIESGLIFAGYDFDDQTDPFEAGIGFSVALKTKEDDFIGRAALERRKANPQKKLVGLELEGNEAAVHGDCVRIGRAQIGVITSGMKSPMLNKNIALCRIDVAHAEVGTEVEVGKMDGHQKRIPAVVTAFPAYDPKKERPRS